MKDQYSTAGRAIAPLQAHMTTLGEKHSNLNNNKKCNKINTFLYVSD